ncbi:MAG: hypothetical protein KDD62_01990 [Bdellovibrionales bacterium]|nr:hypothetical protein [Bdellovibrionales bacterium]
MSYSVTVQGIQDPSQTYELVGEALSSANPPLSRAARDEIEFTKAQRIATLFGSNLENAQQIFDAIIPLPPVLGIQLEAELMELMEIVNPKHPCPLEPTPPQDKKVSEEKPPVVQDWGFLEVTAPAFSYENELIAEDTVAIDLVKARRNEEDFMEKFVQAFQGIESEELRISLIEDCLKIISLKFDFDFSPRPC